MKKQNKIYLGIGIVIVFLIAAIAIFSIAKLNTEDQTIRMGSILILSGGGSAWGEAARNGIDLAVKDINGAGGVLGKKIIVIYEDDQANPTNTVTAFKKLTEVQNIDFIIGPTWTKQGLAIKDLVDDEVVISPSLGGLKFNENNKYIFNSRQHDYILSQNLANYVFKKGYRTVAILSVNDEYNKEQADEFKKVFEKLGGEVKFVLDPMIDQRDVRSDLIKVKNDNGVDALIAMTGGTVLTSIFAIQIKELGLEQPVFSVTIDQTRIDESRGACNGWKYLSSFTPNKKFSQRYLTIYGTKVHIGSDSAYDAVVMLANAMNETNSINPKLVQEYLNGLKKFSGVSGTLISDGQGGFTKNYKVLEVRKGTSFELG